MRIRILALACCLVITGFSTCDPHNPPTGLPLLPGPDQEGYDADLEALARQYDRSFHVFTSAGMGVNVGLTVPVENESDHELVDEFIRETDEWDFEAWSGSAVFDVVTNYHMAAGLYAGVGIAADAYRYGVLRDQGYPEEEVARAREHLIKGLEALHVAQAITGEPGVIARGLFRLDIPGNADQIELTPLFDEYGNPLPLEKDNGTWRADNSGLYPNYIWIDSCSRDMFIGWATAFACTWEVIREDPAFTEDLKDRLQEDARLLGMGLATVQESGFDLEIMDADGRTTYHGYLNEHNIERIYLPWLPLRNGSYALMAMGCVGAFAYTAEDQELTSYLHDHLIAERKLHNIFWRHTIGIDMGIFSNYSGYNMAFQTAFLASRFVDDPDVQEALRVALEIHLYDHVFRHNRQAREIKQSLFDFVFALGTAGSNVWEPMAFEPDIEAVARGVETLHEFPIPPYWNYGVTHCDQDEIDAGVCELNDGTMVDLLGDVGWNDNLVAADPIPMRIRPPSNYHWRSNPYEVNRDGDGSHMNPGVDFRWAYWLGRWAR